MRARSAFDERLQERVYPRNYPLPRRSFARCRKAAFPENLLTDSIFEHEFIGAQSYTPRRTSSWVVNCRAKSPAVGCWSNSRPTRRSSRPIQPSRPSSRPHQAIPLQEPLSSTPNPLQVLNFRDVFGHISFLAHAPCCRSSANHTPAFVGRQGGAGHRGASATVRSASGGPCKARVRWRPLIGREGRSGHFCQ